jgi:hypothetical protein
VPRILHDMLTAVCRHKANVVTRWVIQVRVLRHCNSDSPRKLLMVNIEEAFLSESSNSRKKSNGKPNAPFSPWYHHRL